MSKTLFTEKNSPTSFRVKSIKEEIKPEIAKSGMMIVRNVPSTILGEKNQNGRIYTANEMGNALKEASSKGLFEARSLLCTADDHPEGTFPKPSNASHICLGAKVESVQGKDVLFNDWLVLNTEQGKNLRALIEAGASIGTSIRGVGVQNESTGEIENYEYFGTDVVGNPSAGTFAPFQGLNESLEEGIVVEAVSAQSAKTISESLKLEEKQQDNKSSTEDLTEMKFNLQSAIELYKKTHSAKRAIEKAYDAQGKEIQLAEAVTVSNYNVTSEAISDILAIEKQVIESGEGQEAFQEFKNEVLGSVPSVKEESEEDKEVKAEQAKSEDILNKSERQTEAAEIVAGQLREQCESLLEEKAKLKKMNESSNKLIAEMTNRVKEAIAKANAKEASIEENEKAIVEEVKSIAATIIEEIQAEAQETILHLESQLEQTIQIGDTISSHFQASKIINEALHARLKTLVAKEAAKKEDAVVSTKESKVEEKIRSNHRDIGSYLSNKRGWK